MNLASQLLASGDPHAIVIYAGPAQISYAELRASVDRTATALLSIANRPQDRVAILSENSIFFVVSYLAIIRAGLVAVPIPTDASPGFATAILRDAGAVAIFVSKAYESRLAHWNQPPGLRVLGETFIAACDGDKRPEPLPETMADDDLAALMFTSGSTGTPKGVMVSHRNISSNTADIVDYLQLTTNDRAMVVLPFYYCFGLSLLHTHLMAGGSLVINNQFMYPERVLQEMDTRTCTGIAGVPSTFQILLRKSRFAASRFPSLRWLQQAGGALPTPQIREIIDACPGLRVFVMYGQTEATARLSYLPPEYLPEKLGSIGKGLRSTRLEVLGPGGLPVQAGSDEIGEIVASGPNVTRGYWNDPLETAKYFREGRLYTGDLARVDADGFIYVVDREREFVKSGGNRVSVKEIENTIAELPHVVEVAVVGTPHEALGEAIVAFVAVAPQATEQASVLDHCRRHLPVAKIPEAVFHVRELPHSGSGKVMKSTLRRFAAELVAGDSGQVAPTPVLTAEVCIVKTERRAASVAERTVARS